MKKNILIAALFSSSILLTFPLKADDFSISFEEWGDFKKCTSGNPIRVTNPIFKLNSVPEGTVLIKFSLQDLNARSYHHGGGKIKYSGQEVTKSGAFKYESPCPPRGVHTYQWTAKAYDAEGEVLAKAKVKKKYPE